MLDAARIERYTRQSESEWLLVGSTDPDGIAVFELLLGVSGVGPRVALALLSLPLSPDLRSSFDQDEAPGVYLAAIEQMGSDHSAVPVRFAIRYRAPRGDFFAAREDGLDGSWTVSDPGFAGTESDYVISWVGK